MKNNIIPRSIFNQLTPQCRKIIAHIERAGHITADAAITYYRIMSLPRRINDIEAKGVQFQRERRKHPSTGQHYVAYSIKPDQF